MSRAEDEHDRGEVSRLLAGAAKTIASVRYCWLTTASKAGGANVTRPMGRLPPEPGDDDWTIRFVTDGRSRKASDIRHAGRVALIFQRDADDAFVTLTGAAALRERPSEVAGRWKDAYNRYFPRQSDARAQLSSRSRPSGWSFGSAASRRNRLDCTQRRSSGTLRASWRWIRRGQHRVSAPISL